MWSEYNYISINEILSRILRHPLLQECNLETAIQYTIDFIGIMGIPNIYTDNIATIEINNHRGKLPCDLVAITQVKKDNVCIRQMTDSFIEESIEPTFKTKGNIIFTSFKEGKLFIAYKAIQTDVDGLPMLPNNPVFLKALELYIKKEWFTVLFDMGKISQAVFNNTKQEYAFKAGQCRNEFIIPSISEMESFTRMFNTLLSRTTSFDNSFRDLGNREYIKVH